MDELEPEIEISDSEDSVVADRGPKAPAMVRLGRYRIVCELASGGMATVNLAIADGLDKLLALKVIHPQLAKEESFVRMFLDEARIASSVSHRNVCNVFDYGEQDGCYYMAMDYLAGSTLRDVVRKLRGKRAPQAGNGKYAAAIAYVIAQACEGLHAAHELRGNDGELMEVVHRDVSPHNLFVTYDGNVSVVDFGIARASDRLQQTATGVLKGKFSYMAPEQIRQRSVDRRADIWALGVCLWEALTLRRLFARATQADTLMSVMSDPIKPPSEMDGTLPVQLDAICARALARDVDQRYRSAREMARDLMAFCRDSGSSMSPMELEHFMEELFPKEQVQSRELVRRAKQSAAEDTDMYMGPSPTHSGAVLRHPLRTNPGTPVSNVGAFTGSFQPQLGGARDTSLPVARPPRVKGFLYGALCAGALSAAGFFALASSRQPPPVVMQHEHSKVAPDAASEPSQPSTPVQPAAAASTPNLAPQAMPEPRRETARAAADEAEEQSARAAAQNSWRAQSRPPARAGRSGRAAQDDVQADNAKHDNAKHDSAKHEGKAQAEQESADSKPELAAAAPEPKLAEPAAPAQDAAPQPKPQAVAPSKPEPAKPDHRPLDASVALANIQAAGSLGPGTVSRMLGRTLPLLRTCYQNAAKAAGRNDFSPLNLSFVIDESGGVRNSKGASHPLSGLSSCSAEAIKRARSDQKPDTGTVQVQVQVTFRGL